MAGEPLTSAWLLGVGFSPWDRGWSILVPPHPRLPTVAMVVELLMVEEPEGWLVSLWQSRPGDHVAPAREDCVLLTSRVLGTVDEAVALFRELGLDVGDIV